MLVRRLPRRRSNRDGVRGRWDEMEFALTPDVGIDFTWQGHGGSHQPCRYMCLPEKDKRSLDKPVLRLLDRLATVHRPLVLGPPTLNSNPTAPYGTLNHVAVRNLRSKLGHKESIDLPSQSTRLSILRPMRSVQYSMRTPK